MNDWVYIGVSLAHSVAILLVLAHARMIETHADRLGAGSLALFGGLIWPAILAVFALYFVAWAAARAVDALRKAGS